MRPELNRSCDISCMHHWAGVPLSARRAEAHLSTPPLCPCLLPRTPADPAPGRARTPSASRPQSSGVSPRGTRAAMSYHPLASPSPLESYNTSAPFRASPPRARAAVTLSGSVFSSREGSPQKPPPGPNGPASPSGRSASSPGGSLSGRFRGSGTGAPDSPTTAAAAAAPPLGEGFSLSTLEDIRRQREAVAREQARLAAEWRQLEELSRRLEAGGAASASASGEAHGAGAGGEGARAGAEPAALGGADLLPGTVAFSPLGSGFSLEEEVEAINAATEARAHVVPF